MTNKKTQKCQDATKAKILIVDDHAIVRKGLTLLLNQEPDIMVCAEAESAAQALDIINHQSFDLAVVDITLGSTSGIELTREIKSQYPQLPVLILTMHSKAVYAKRALEAGAAGYITKHEAVETIVDAIRLTLSGKDYITKSIVRKLS